MMSEIADKIKKLKAEIAKHDRAYHTLDAPLISDSNYDELRKSLEKYREEFPQFFVSEKEKVGGKALEGFSKITHKKPMLSLANGFSVEDISDFFDRVNRFLGLDKKEEAVDLFSFSAAPKLEFFCETKIDGLSFSARFEDGKLTQSATRGDGFEGEDVTENIKTLQNFPQLLQGAPKVLEIRGEIYMGRKDFEELNARQEEQGAKIFLLQGPNM